MSRQKIVQDFQRFAVARIAGGALVGGLSTVAAFAFLAAPASARAMPEALTSNWCGAHGATFARWAGSSPNIAICGPGPGYGGGWSYVNVPGPAGSYAGYQNSTPGFQCVELAERYLALAYGFSAVRANGAQVAANYHATYPRTALYTNGTVGHAPASGDVISFSSSSQFAFGDGHVAIVTNSSVNSRGDGTVTVAQENVSAADYVDTLRVSHWRLFDPAQPSNAEFQFPAAEWLHVSRLTARAAIQSAFLPASAGSTGQLTGTGPSVQRGAPLSFVLASVHLPSTAAVNRTPARSQPPYARPHVNDVLPASSANHAIINVRAVSGAGLGLMFVLSSFALVLAGIRHRRLQGTRRPYGAHSAGYGPASRRLASDF